MNKIPLIFIFFATVNLVHAQFIVITGSTPYTSPYDLEYRSDGILIAKGEYSTGSLHTGDQGAGTRFLWYPAKAALRAGQVDGTQWDSSSIGNYSVATGFDTIASGSYAVAAGFTTSATGRSAVALGYMTNADGYYSTATGIYAEASGNAASAFGRSTTATGNNAMSLGLDTTAAGAQALSLGNGTIASGTNSISSGGNTTASSYGCLTLGRFNVDLGTTGAIPTANSWVATDPIFEIGNGTNSSNLSNAMTVYKNGSSTFQGIVTGQAGFMTTPASVSSADIPMFGH